MTILFVHRGSFYMRDSSSKTGIFAGGLVGALLGAGIGSKVAVFDSEQGAGLRFLFGAGCEGLIGYLVGDAMNARQN
jgi:hypothetical protein